VRFQLKIFLTLPLTVLFTLVTLIASSPVYEGFSLTFPQYNTGSGFSAAWQPGGFNAFASGYTAHMRADFLPGNDTFTLYTNPVPGAPEPVNGVVKADLNLGVASKIGIYSSGAFSVDEIRIGSTYADVTPRSLFAGTPGAANCHGKTVSGLTQQYEDLANAASGLGYASVQALQNAIASFCAM